MPTSLSDERKEIDLAMFFSFNDTVIDNLGSDLQKERRENRDNEIAGEEAIKYAADKFRQEDTYMVEHTITDADGHRCIITTDWLYQAVCNLEERQKEVLILRFWHLWTSKEIAKKFDVTERTIYNWTQKAYETIRNYYERNEIK